MINSNLQSFKLEHYLSKYEFSTPYLLCCSDAESYNLHELLGMASSEEISEWNNLRLGYTQVKGAPKLRQSIAEALYPQLTQENILCFAGAEDGIFCTLFTLCQPGDHVIVVTPCYQSLAEVPRTKGCKITAIELQESNDWKINIDHIANAIEENTKLVIINFPHNPTGQIITREELQDLIFVLKKNNIWLFADEVYRLLGLPTGGWSNPAACEYEYAISLGVMSKAFGLAGLRIGWIACKNLDLLKRIEHTKHYTSICNSAPSEILATIALNNIDKILARNNRIITDNLLLLDSFFLQNANKLGWVKPQGGCIGFVKLKLTEKVDDFCERLVDDMGVLLLPASIYDIKTNHFRIGFGRKNMPEALELFIRFLNK